MNEAVFLNGMKAHGFGIGEIDTNKCSISEIGSVAIGVASALISGGIGAGIGSSVSKNGAAVGAIVGGALGTSVAGAALDKRQHPSCRANSPPPSSGSLIKGAVVSTVGLGGVGYILSKKLSGTLTGVALAGALTGMAAGIFCWSCDASGGQS